MPWLFFHFILKGAATWTWAMLFTSATCLWLNYCQNLKCAKGLFSPSVFLKRSSTVCVESLCPAEAMTTLNQATNSQCGVFTYKCSRKCVARMMEKGRIILASPSPRRRQSPGYGGERKARAYIPKWKKLQQAHGREHLFRTREVLLDVQVLSMAGAQSSVTLLVRDQGVLLDRLSPSSCRTVPRSVVMVVLLFGCWYLTGRSAHLNWPSRGQNMDFLEAISLN